MKPKRIYNVSKSLEQRFWEKVKIIDDEDSCWEWQASCWESGYGRMIVEQKPKLAHRISYWLNYGPFDYFWKVLHKCDNRKCVRPNHLYLGGQLENMKDMYERKRNNHKRKLTEKEVKTVRSSPLSHTKIAEIIGTSESNIRQIRNRKTFKWVK